MRHDFLPVGEMEQVPGERLASDRHGRMLHDIGNVKVDRCDSEQAFAADAGRNARDETTYVYGFRMLEGEPR